MEKHRKDLNGNFGNRIISEDLIWKILKAILDNSEGAKIQEECFSCDDIDMEASWNSLLKKLKKDKPIHSYQEHLDLKSKIADFSLLIINLN